TRLPLANDCHLLIDDVVGPGRIWRDEQDKNVAGAEVALDFRAPVVAAVHQPVRPDLDGALLLGGPEIAGHERKPFDLAIGRLLGLVRVRIADENDRPIWGSRHDRNAGESATLRSNSRKSSCGLSCRRACNDGRTSFRRMATSQPGSRFISASFRKP